MSVPPLLLCITYFSIYSHLCSWHTMELPFLASLMSPVDGTGKLFNDVSRLLLSAPLM